MAMKRISKTTMQEGNRSENNAHSPNNRLTDKVANIAAREVQQEGQPRAAAWEDRQNGNKGWFITMKADLF